jgi:hypothetical protein
MPLRAPARSGYGCREEVDMAGAVQIYGKST